MLEQEDKEWFTQNMELTVMRVLAPIKELAEKHETTLFGATGDNGLNSDMRDMKKEVGAINKKIYSFTGIITGAGMLLHVIYDNFLKGGK